VEVLKDPWMHRVTIDEANAEVTPEQSCTKRGPIYKGVFFWIDFRL